MTAYNTTATTTTNTTSTYTLYMGQEPIYVKISTENGWQPVREIRVSDLAAWIPERETDVDDELLESEMPIEELLGVG